MPPRTIAIGDIHGCTPALCALLKAVAPAAEDTVVVLGDMVDRGPDSRGTVERLLALADECRLVTILGNHDEMLLDIADGGDWLLDDWLHFGGDATLASYACKLPEELPPEHLQFLESCLDYYETDGHIFLHATYRPDRPLADQPPSALRWESLREAIPPPHQSGKRVVVGHTSQKDGEILDAGHVVCIDTFCYGGKWLTALDVASGRLWQADPQGRLRPGVAHLQHGDASG